MKPRAVPVKEPEATFVLLGHVFELSWDGRAVGDVRGRRQETLARTRS